jgi:hypothetical protein
VKIKMMALRPLDCLIITVGLIGTFNVFGLLGNVPNPITVILGLFCTMMFFLSIGPLTISLFLGDIGWDYRRLHCYHALANLVPTLYLLAHLKETPWGGFVC